MSTLPCAHHCPVSLLLKSGKTYFTVYRRTLVRLKADGNNCWFHYIDGSKQYFQGSMGSFLWQLRPMRHFVRVSKSNAANMLHMVRANKSSGLELIGDVVLHITELGAKNLDAYIECYSNSDHKTGVWDNTEGHSDNIH